MTRKLIILFFSLLFSYMTFSQSYTTESKSCGSCGKAVSVKSKVGDRCPHCGVRWGYENTTTKTSYYNNYSSPNYSYTPSYSYSSGDVIFSASNVNLREGPSTKSEIKTTIPAFSNVTVIRVCNNWYYVKYVKNSYYYGPITYYGYVYKPLF